MPNILHAAAITLMSTSLMLAGPLEAVADHHKPAKGHHCDPSENGSHMEKGDHYFKGLQRALDKMDLTETQQDKIKQILSDAEARIKTLHKQIREGHYNLRNLSMTEHFDVDAVQKYADAQAERMAEMMVQRVHVKTQVFAVLNPEQRLQLKEKLGAHCKMQ